MALRATAGRLLRSTSWGSALLDRPEVWQLRLAMSRAPYTRLGGGDVLIAVDGVQLELSARFARHYMSFEPLTVRWLKDTLKPGTTMANVGAHVGFVALVAARAVGADGRVFAVEPAADNLDYLRRNIARNGAHNVIVLPYAAGAASSRRTFHMTGSSDSHGFFSHPNTGTARLEEVQQIRLDDHIKHADVVTIDVEGAELDVLSGMQQLLSRRPVLLVEWAPDCQAAAGRSPGELADVLRAHGYELSVIDDLAGKRREVAEVFAQLSAGQVQPGWYGNVVCVPA